MFALWPPDYGDRARRCARDGMNAGEIARELGVPRSTVRGWLSGRSRPDGVDRRRIPRPEFDTLPGASYAYLLGVYLGDGYIAELERTCALRVFCDSRYPRIIREITRAIRAILPAYSVAVKKDPVQNVTRLITNYRWWPVLFPQHGPGRKHEREISLESWQREITERHPESLIRGLIHSDGCRVVATIRKGKKRYRYSRLLLCQPIRGHQGDLLRPPRSPRNLLDKVEPERHSGRAARGRRGPRRVRGRKR